MSTAITDAAWHDDDGSQRWLVIPDDVDPTATRDTRDTLDLEQLDGGWTAATEEETTTSAAVEQALTASGWHPWRPWQDISATRAVVAVTRETR